MRNKLLARVALVAIFSMHFQCVKKCLPVLRPGASGFCCETDEFYSSLIWLASYVWTSLIAGGVRRLNASVKCCFPLAEARKKQQTFFSHTSGSMSARLLTFLVAIRHYLTSLPPTILGFWSFFLQVSFPFHIFVGLYLYAVSCRSFKLFPGPVLSSFVLLGLAWLPVVYEKSGCKEDPFSSLPFG